MRLFALISVVALTGCPMQLALQEEHEFPCESDSDCSTEEGYQCVDRVCRLDGVPNPEPEPEPEPEAGPDPEPDAGDGGFCCPSDSGDPSDAADAGDEDAGEQEDAGDLSDGGVEEDAGDPPEDGGDPPDDAGDPLDAGEPYDAGDPVDAGDCDGPPPTMWYPDEDGDGYGLTSAGQLACGPPDTFWIEEDGDCNDDPTIDPDTSLPIGAAYQPQAVEMPADGEDSNCDGQELCYRNDDGDPFGVAITVLDDDLDCANSANQPGDCNDDDADVYPGVLDTPYNGVDEDCGGEDDYDADEDGSVRNSDVGLVTYDGFDMSTMLSGTGGLPGGDCNDMDAFFTPFDGDSDGFTTCDATPDCDDDDTFSAPNLEEVFFLGADRCNDGADNDCDGDADLDDVDCQDVDEDGIPNLVDAIFGYDDDGDGVREYLCVNMNLAFSAPWNAGDAIRYGNPSGEVGGFQNVLDPAQTAECGDPVPGACCHDYTLATETTYTVLYAHELGMDGVSPVDVNDCNDWVESELQAFCEFYADQYCRDYGASDDCGVHGYVMNATYSAAQGF